MLISLRNLKCKNRKCNSPHTPHPNLFRKDHDPRMVNEHACHGYDFQCRPIQELKPSLFSCLYHHLSPPNIQKLFCQFFFGSYNQKVLEAKRFKDEKTCGYNQPPRYAFFTSSLAASSAPVPLSTISPSSNTYALSEIARDLPAFCSTSRIVVPSSLSCLIISNT